jgi:hypothetical protein
LQLTNCILLEYTLVDPGFAHSNGEPEENRWQGSVEFGLAHDDGESSEWWVPEIVIVDSLHHGKPPLNPYLGSVTS